MCQMQNFFHPKTVIEFYENLREVKSKKEISFTVMSKVNGNSISLEKEFIANKLGLPCEGFDGYPKGEWPKFKNLEPLKLARKFNKDHSRETTKAVLHKEMIPNHVLWHALVVRMIVARSSRKDASNGLDMTLMELLIHGEKINLHVLTLKHMVYVAKHRNHALPYGIWLSKLSKSMRVMDLEDNSEMDKRSYFE